MLINTNGKGKAMTIIAVGIDLAKHVFAVHGVDEAGRAALVLRQSPEPGCTNWSPRWRHA